MKIWRRSKISVLQRVCNSIKWFQCVLFLHIRHFKQFVDKMCTDEILSISSNILWEFTIYQVNFEFWRRRGPEETQFWRKGVEDRILIRYNTPSAARYNSPTDSFWISNSGDFKFVPPKSVYNVSLLLTPGLDIDPVSIHYLDWTSGNLTPSVVQRASRVGPLKEVLENQLFPKYSERWRLLNECMFTLTFSGVGTNCKGYQGHLDADWRDQVKEGLQAMNVRICREF